MVLCFFNFKYFSQNLVRLDMLGIFEKSGPADFKSVPGFVHWTRFAGVIEQKKYSYLMSAILLLTKTIGHILVFISLWKYILVTNRFFSFVIRRGWGITTNIWNISNSGSYEISYIFFPLI